MHTCKYRLHRTFSLFNIPHYLYVYFFAHLIHFRFTCSLKIDSSTPASIIALCTKKYANTFNGDVLTVYGLACARNINSPVKAQLVHVDLTDQYGQMTISVTMANDLIECFATFFSRGASVSISNFVVKQKTVFERGDADVCIHLSANSTVASVPVVCHVRRLAPNTTLHGLRSSDSNYVVGSIAAAVAHCHQTSNQYHFTIKDGENINDTALVKNLVHVLLLLLVPAIEIVSCNFTTFESALL